MHPEAERLAKAMIGDFWAADHSIKWWAVEQEHLLWISSNTVLVGKVDAVGETEDGRLFFADWKTASKSKAGSGKYKEKARLQLKNQWRMDPQALTYGLLMGGDQVRGQSSHPYTADSEINPLIPEIREFLVRWAFKTDPATTDFEWYEYKQAELDWWQEELLGHAAEIRALRVSTKTSHQNWPTNLKHCSRYGEDYKCPFRDEGCWKLNFGFAPASYSPRDGSHLSIENTLKSKYKSLPENGELVVLDASRVDDWLGCSELYRRKWEHWVDNQSGKCYDGLSETNEALEIGQDFHSLIAAHLTSLMQRRSKNAT